MALWGRPDMDSSCVLLVEDDASLREALEDLVRSVGLDVLSFSNVPDFLQAKTPDVPCCLVVDVRLPGQSGLDLQAELVRRRAPRRSSLSRATPT